VLVQDEDAQGLEEPIIAPVEVKSFDLVVEDIELLPKTTFTKEFLLSMTKMPELIRNFCVVGLLHHGKTSLFDFFIRNTHINRMKVLFFL
jgi:U5 small nuclear ribonucleoprotein component